jgi:uncharacterized protein (TIGR02145 family)
MATGGGYIINDGGAPIASRGLCWSINSGPTITLSTITNDGSGTGVYTSNLTGLIPNTTYYVRAYATNNVGTVYGNEISFTSSTFTNLPNVTICSQIWMTQNLSASTYRNGDSIPNITNPTIWAGLTTGAWCWYNNDSATFAATFGKLYNWYAVSDSRGIAPVGWHVPNDSEWNRMVKCTDPFSDTTCSNCSKSSTAGGALKETGLGHWMSPNYGATNSTGFSAIPSGFFLSFFTNIGMDSYMWSSSEVNSTLSKTFNINSVSSDLYSSSQIKQYGFSVRCLRD